MTTPRILAVLSVVTLATVAPLDAQIISVPRPDQSTRPVTATFGFGFLQTASRYDGQSGTQWNLSEALQYRGSLDFGLRSGAIGLSASLASVPINRRGGTAPSNSDGNIQLRQILATFRTPESEGPHQIIEVGLGLAQWASYSGTDVLTADEAAARNAFALVVGYGFGFTLGQRASLLVVQDLATLWGSAEGLPAGTGRSVRQYTTRVSMRYRFRGSR